MTSFYLLTQVGFIATTILYFGLLFVFVWNGLSRTTYSADKKRRIIVVCVSALIGWLAITGVLSYTGFFSNFDGFPPRFFLALIIPLVLIVFATTRKVTLEILQYIPTQQLVYLQSFRIIVEILLWMLFVDQLLPVQMTFEGLNFDVISGATAIIMGYLISRRKAHRLVVIAWNFACLGLLINIVTIAILSTPTPFRIFMNEPANTIVTNFPIIWLPAALVPLAYLLHILSLRQLFNKPVATPL
jgi:hypothetical protein